MSRHKLPFAQRLAVVMIHLLFGQSYASLEHWTPLRRAMCHLVCALFMPIIQLFVGRCHPYSSATSASRTAATHSDTKSLITTPTIYKHMLEHIADLYEETGVPPVLLSEGNFDQILGRLQTFMRDRSSHRKDAIATGMDLLWTDMKNEIKSGVSMTGRDKKNEQTERKLGRLMVRPLVFSNCIASELPFQNVASHLAKYHLQQYLVQVTLAAGSSPVHVLADPGDPDVTCMLSTLENLKSAYTDDKIWFFCLCAGPDNHTAPCCLGV